MPPYILFFIKPTSKQYFLTIVGKHFFSVCLLIMIDSTEIIKKDINNLAKFKNENSIINLKLDSSTNEKFFVFR